MNAIPQDLPLFCINKDSKGVATLVTFLKDHPAWHHASAILEAWAQPDTEHNKRVVRALAEAASPEIISGQTGYKWIGHATPEEIHHAAAALESQAKKMADRATAIRKRAHELFGRPPVAA